jgi:hypothetical protein
MALSIIYASFVPLLTLHSSVSQLNLLPKGSTQLNIKFFRNTFPNLNFIVCKVRNMIVLVVNFYID